MSSSKVTILGINGRIGQEAAKAFVAEGWHVIGMGRSNRARLAGVEFVQGGAESPADVRAACADADVVVNALNLPYDKWGDGRAEAQLAAVIAGLKGSGKTLIFPGNIYNYGAQQHVITPDSPQRPEKERGEIRKRMEEMLARAAVEEELQVIIVRSGDFYAPGAEGTFFDQAILARLKSGIVQYPADLPLGHSWAYLPDLGRAYVKLATTRAELPKFENFQFRGHFVTGHEMVAAIQAALPTPAKVVAFPWWMLKLIGLVSPVMRDVVKMRYLWREPHQLRDEKLEALLGADFHTPFETAMARAVRSYLPALEGKPSRQKANARA